MEDQQQRMEEQKQRIEELEKQNKQLLVEMEIKNQNFRELAVNQYKMWSDYAKEASVPRESMEDMLEKYTFAPDRSVKYEPEHPEPFRQTSATSEVLSAFCALGERSDTKLANEHISKEVRHHQAFIAQTRRGTVWEVMWRAGGRLPERVALSLRPEGVHLNDPKYGRLAEKGFYYTPLSSPSCDWDKTRGFKNMCEEFAQIWKTYKRVGIVSLDNAPVPGTDRWYDKYGNIYNTT